MGSTPRSHALATRGRRPREQVSVLLGLTAPHPTKKRTLYGRLTACPTINPPHKVRSYYLLVRGKPAQLSTPHRKHNAFYRILLVLGTSC